MLFGSTRIPRPPPLLPAFNNGARGRRGLLVMLIHPRSAMTDTMVGLAASRPNGG